MVRATIKRPAPVIVPEPVVTLTMTEDMARLLYGLLSHIRRQDGFDPIHSALKSLGISKQDVHMDFVSPQVLRVTED